MGSHIKVCQNGRGLLIKLSLIFVNSYNNGNSILDYKLIHLSPPLLYWYLQWPLRLEEDLFGILEV